MNKSHKRSPFKSPFVKILLECNLIDPFSTFTRKIMRKIGVVDVYDEAYYWNGRQFIRDFIKKFWKYNIKGESNFPEYGGAVVVSNHQSELDPFIVACSVHRKVRYLSKIENFSIPIFKSVITPFGVIPIKRGQSDKEAMDKVRNVLKSGGCMGLFPEGTRSPDGKLLPFHKGAAHLAIETGVPYVPCAIFGAHEIFPKNQTVDKIKFKGGYEISITIGKPVYIDPTLEANIETADLVKNAMREDVLKLQNGEMNQSRIIGLNKEIPITSITDLAKYGIKTAENKEISQGMSIS
ncbi:MAG: lysophospholipid acyltransferase family protein [Promethearchaeota archaeon]